MPEYRLAWYRGKLAAVWYDENGKRYRHSLSTANQSIATTRLAEFARVHSLQTTGAPVTVAAIYQAYVNDRAADGKPVARMHDAWKRLAATFGSLLPSHITKATCQTYMKERRGRGISNGTIHVELAYLRASMKHAENERWIPKAPFVPLPKKPRPRHHYLTKAEASRLVAAATLPHVKLFVILALATAGRASAILGLTWDRIDYERRTIDLRDPNVSESPKGRAIVPMNDMALKALQEAQRGALTTFVIEWAGKPVQSVKKAVGAAAQRAGVKASPHVLRHSAAVWMAEGGTKMEEIAQYLGHSTAATTYKVYARYSPGHLRKAANALEL